MSNWMFSGRIRQRRIQASIRSRTILPLISPVVACQAMISRSQVSIAKAMRTASPFQHPISSTSDARRWLDAKAMTRGSSRPREPTGR